MKLFDIPLKLIDHFNMTDSDNLIKLTNDVRHWESDATEEHEDKVKSVYGKLHKGVYLRLALPIVWFWILKEFTSIAKGDDDDKLLEDL